MNMSPKVKAYGALVCATILLSSCGGGGGSPTFASLESRGENLVNAADALWLSEGYSDPSALPSEGQATYNGIVGIVTFSESLVVYGEMELVADFSGPGSISGSADNFVDNENTYYDGSVVLSNGAIDRLADTDLEYTFFADADGTLSDSSDDYLIDGSLEGDFIGDSREYVEGLVDGTVTSSLGTEGFLGGFVGELQ